MPAIGKHDMLGRCCLCIHLLSTRALTIKQLSLESGIPISSVRRYVDAISSYFPITEEDTKNDRGAICKQYRIDSLVDKSQLKKDLKREVCYLIDKSL